MHISLVVKEDAGDGDHDLGKLERSIRDAGHQVRGCTTDGPWRELLADGADLVLIAGGDGTVSKVILELVDGETPFAIIPLGTANNIAGHLGWIGGKNEVLDRLDSARQIKLDLGVARGPWGTVRFVEGVGVGPFTRAMTFAEADSKDVLWDPSSTPNKLVRDLRLVKGFLHDSTTGSWSVTVDGRRQPGTFLMTEVMNIGSIGPGLQLAPDADPTDGSLDVVLAGEADRERLDAYLEARLEGTAGPPELTSVSGSSIRLEIDGARLHIDDALWPDASEAHPPAGTSFVVEITVERGAVTALAPSPEDRI